MKMGVRAFPPLTFRALCMVFGLLTIGLIALKQKIHLRIPPGHLPKLIHLSIPNMMIWHVFVILGVKMLSSGRAAILGFTMPMWAVLAGLFVYGDRVTRIAWVGVICAMAGAVLLLSSEFSALSGKPLGSLLVLISAAGWGYGTVLIKRTHMEMSSIALSFWMLAFTTILMILLAAVFEHQDWRMPDHMEWIAIGYNAVIVFGFAHVVWFQLARSLPPVASSLSVMMIPVVGVFSGAWMLGETPHWQDYGAILLILLAMSTVLLKPRDSAHS